MKPNHHKSLAFLAFLISSFFTLLNTKGAERPNVIIILVDDLGYRDLSYTGCTDFKTPNIDRLAKNGVIFTNGYANHSFCAPTRAALVTGRYQHRFGFETNPAFAPRDRFSGLPKEEITIADRLKKVGYRTGVIGKWHLGSNPVHHPLNRGFDRFFGMLGGGHDYFAVDSTQLDQSYKTALVDDKSFANVEGYITHQLTDKAIDFISDDKEEPFFLYLSYNAPHSPWQAPQETINELKHIKGEERRIYAAMVVEMDRDIGRLVKVLEESGKDKNTLIFFQSDNGGPQAEKVTDNKPFRGEKGDFYEGGVHVPFFAYWPKMLKAGTKFTHPVISMDMTVTAAAVAGADVSNMEGKNLLPHLQGKKEEPPHEYLFFRRRDGVVWSILSHDGLKLIKPHWIGDKMEFYDLKNDPSEKNNIISDRTKDVERLHSVWKKWDEGNERYRFLDYPDHYKAQDALYKKQRSMK